MKKICLPLLTLILSQSILFSMEDPNRRQYEATEKENTEELPKKNNRLGFEDISPEIHQYMQRRFLGPKDAANLGKANHFFKDIHDQHFSPYYKKKLTVGIKKIIQAAIKQDMFAKAKAVFTKLKLKNLSGLNSLLAFPKKMNDPNFLHEIYSPEYVIKNFGGKNTPLKLLLQRFKNFIENENNLGLELFLKALSQKKKDISKTLKLQKKKESLNKLDLHNKHITYLPPEIFHLPNLKVLWLSKNNLKSLPSKIINLNHLEKLYLHYNPHLTLSSSTWIALLNLPHLSYIDLSETSVPEQLRKTFKGEEGIAEFKHLVLEHIKESDPNYGIDEQDKSTPYSQLPPLVKDKDGEDEPDLLHDA